MDDRHENHQFRIVRLIPPAILCVVLYVIFLDWLHHVLG
jgi:hypothetical protein